jgi:hypothetical protein
MCTKSIYYFLNLIGTSNFHTVAFCNECCKQSNWISTKTVHFCWPLCTGVIDYVAGLFFWPVAIFSRWRCKVYMETVSTFSCSPYFFFKTWNGVEIIILTFKQSIRAEVVTFRLDIVFGSLHTQQLHGFNELRNDREIIQNRSAKIDKTAASPYLPSSYSNYQFLRLTQKHRANKIVFF